MRILSMTKRQRRNEYQMAGIEGRVDRLNKLAGDQRITMITVQADHAVEAWVEEP